MTTPAIIRREAVREDEAEGLREEAEEGTREEAAAEDVTAEAGTTTRARKARAKVASLSRMSRAKANPFATPLEILPEWYLYPVFQILRVVPNKLLGIALQTLIPLGLMILPFIENVNKFSNPFRRPIAMSVFLFGTFLTIYLGIGACLPIDKSLTLGLF